MNSQTVTVTVTAPPTCTAPFIQQNPQSTSVDVGQTATLSVTAIGTSLVYQWYQGASGVTTTPVGTNSRSFTTPALTQDTSYWVRIMNACGQAASRAATVTVKPPRRRPVRA